MPKKLTQAEFQQRVKEYTSDQVEVIGQYVNKRTPVLVKCKKCGYEWSVPAQSFCPSSTNKYHFKGCPECKYVTINCSYCGKEIKRLQSVVNKTNSGFNYCSRECGNKHKASLLKRNDSTAYRRNAFDYYEPKCAICGYDDEIELLEVHHKDENRNNNSLDNLIILCPICHKKLTMHLYTLSEENNILQKLL